MRVRGVDLKATLLPLATDEDSYQPQFEYLDHIHHPKKSDVSWGTFNPDCTAFKMEYLTLQSVSLLVAFRG